MVVSCINLTLHNLSLALWSRSVMLGDLHHNLIELYRLHHCRKGGYYTFTEVDLIIVSTQRLSGHPHSLQKFSLLHCWNGAGVWIGSEKIGRKVCRMKCWCKLENCLKDTWKIPERCCNSFEIKKNNLILRKDISIIHYISHWSRCWNDAVIVSK